MAKIVITSDTGKVVLERYVSPEGADEVKGQGLRRRIKEALVEAAEADAEDKRHAENAKRGGPWVEVAPRMVDRYTPGYGVDHSAEGEVLLKKGSTLLIWRKGHTGWCGIGNQTYYEARLELHGSPLNKSIGGHDFGKTLKRGGRLTKAALAELESQIKEAFGVDELPPLAKGRTFLYVAAGEYVNEKGQVVKAQKAS